MEHQRRRLWRRYHGRRAAAQAVVRNQNISTSERSKRLMRLVNPWARPRAVVIAAGMRTGSTILCELAESLPGVETTYEAINPIAYGWMKLADATEAADLTRDLSLQAPTTVTKVFRSHLKAANTDWAAYAEELPEARWIQLYRHDIAAQFVSLRQAQVSNQWLETSGETKPRPTVELNVDQLRDYYDEIVRDDRAAFDALSGTIGFRRIRYEDFSEDPTAWAEQNLPDILGVSSGSVSHNLKRQDHRDLSQRLSNPESLAEVEALNLRWHPAGSW